MRNAAIAGVVLVAITLAGCGGAGNGYYSPSSPYDGYTPSASCDPGAAVTLVNPAPGTYAGSNPGTLVIAADGNSGALYNATAQFSLVLSDGPSFGPSSPYDSFASNPLQLTSDANGPHPYSSDYYYQATLPQPLLSGETWYVYVVNTQAGCTTGPQAGTFRT